MNLVNELKASLHQLDLAMVKVEKSQTPREYLEALQHANSIAFECTALQELLNKQLNHEDPILQ